MLANCGTMYQIGRILLYFWALIPFRMKMKRLSVHILLALMLAATLSCEKKPQPVTPPDTPVTPDPQPDPDPTVPVVDYDKYTVNGVIQKEITLPTIGGKHVLVTDYGTAEAVTGTSNYTQYNTYLLGEGAFLSCDKNNYENYDKEAPMTILFDEPEVNFDIMTVWNLYHNAFPKICQDFGTQLITVSHSPIVMCEDIVNNEYVNLISIDDDYTKSVKGLLQTMQF